MIVELVFGQTKDARGFRRFLRRGLDAVGAEWSLVCLNLLKLHRAGEAVAAQVASVIALAPRPGCALTTRRLQVRQIGAAPRGAARTDDGDANPGMGKGTGERCALHVPSGVL